MKRNVLNQPLPQAHGPKPIIDTYHHARVALEEFCDKTDRERKLFNDAHDAARSGVFSFVNANLIHEATVFEVVLESFAPGEPSSVFYLVEPRNTEIKRIHFHPATLAREVKPSEDVA